LSDLDPEDGLRFERLVLPPCRRGFQLRALAVAQPRGCGGCRSGSLTSRVPLLSWFSGRRCARLAAADRAHTCYSWLEKNRPRESMVEFDEELHQQPLATPESIAMAVEGRERLTRALETLPSPLPRASRASRARRLFLQGDRPRLRRFLWAR